MLLLTLSIVSIAMQLGGLVLPTKSGYVQRYALSDIPEAPKVRFVEGFSVEPLYEEASANGSPSERGSDLSNAFGSLGRSEIAPSSPHLPRALRSGLPVLNVEFDLARKGVQPGDLKVSKDVMLNGERVGSLQVSIDQTSQIFVASDNLARILPSDLHAFIGGGSNLRSFEDIRARGLDIRYDPVRDVLEIVTGGGEGA